MQLCTIDVVCSSYSQYWLSFGILYYLFVFYFSLVSFLFHAFVVYLFIRIKWNEMKWYHSNRTATDSCCHGNEIFAHCHKSLAVKRRATITLGFATPSSYYYYYHHHHHHHHHHHRSKICMRHPITLKCPSGVWQTSRSSPFIRDAEEQKQDLCLETV